MISLRSTFVAVTLLSTVACGSSASGGDGGPTDGDGGTNNGNDGGGVATAKYLGYISATNIETTVGMTTIHSYTASGSFTQTTGSGSMCTTTKDGACAVVDCVAGDAGTTTYFKAGTVTVDVGNGAKVVTLTQAPQGYYAATSQTESLFTGGEPIVAKTTGDATGAPAVSLSLTAPAKITLTSPALQVGQKLMVSRSAPLPVAWSGGMVGKAFVVLSATGGGRSVIASCTFDESAGSGTIPASVTGKLVAGNGSLAVYGYASTETLSGDWGFIFNAQFPAVTPAGATAVTQTTVQ